MRDVPAPVPAPVAGDDPELVVASGGRVEGDGAEHGRAHVVRRPAVADDVDLREAF